MRNLTILGMFVWLLAACAGGGKSAELSKPASATVNPDSAGMADALHTFFKWYGANQASLSTKMDFINTKVKNPTIDLSLLAKYLGNFSQSGVVSTEFIQNETIFYRACSLAWATETAGDMLTGFEVDRYYCAQDGEYGEFQTAGITYQLDADRATVQLMLNPNGANGGPRNFEMKKENGKWLLSKNLCDAAVLH